VEIQVGDVNEDGQLNNADIQEILRIYLRGEELPADKLRIADVNGDGRVTPQDAQDLYLLIQAGG